MFSAVLFCISSRCGKSRFLMFSCGEMHLSKFESYVLSLFGLGVGPGAIFVRLVFQAVLSLVPVEQSLQDGREAVFCQGTHRTDQLERRKQ